MLFTQFSIRISFNDEQKIADMNSNDESRLEGLGYIKSFVYTLRGNIADDRNWAGPFRFAII